MGNSRKICSILRKSIGTISLGTKSSSTLFESHRSFILHIEIQNVDSQTTSPTEMSKTATVYVFIQGIADNNTLQSTEIQQRWYRNGSGWFVWVEEE